MPCGHFAYYQNYGQTQSEDMDNSNTLLWFLSTDESTFAHQLQGHVGKRGSEDAIAVQGCEGEDGGLQWQIHQGAGGAGVGQR